jgi:hypothetical protein
MPSRLTEIPNAKTIPNTTTIRISSDPIINAVRFRYFAKAMADSFGWDNEYNY